VTAVTSRLETLRDAAKTGATVTVLTADDRVLVGSVKEHATEPETFVFEDLWSHEIAKLDALGVEEVTFE
jgi:hypothetical protein